MAGDPHPESVWQELHREFWKPPADPVMKDAAEAFAEFPEWVKAIFGILVVQTHPAVARDDWCNPTPRSFGRILGQRLASLQFLVATLEASLGRLRHKFIASDGTERPLKITSGPARVLRIPEGTIVEGVLSAMAPFAEAAQAQLADCKAFIGRAQAAVLEKGSPAELAEYSAGIAESAGSPGLSEHGPAGASLATTVYVMMLVHWQEVAGLRSIRELREFLLSLGIAENMVGDHKRIENLAGRIGLRLGRRGRPRKDKNSCP